MKNTEQTPQTPLIGTGKFSPDALSGRVALVTGAGGGIGFEAARALIWLGARVVIAEIDRRSGQAAEERLNREFGAGKALFVHTDVGDEREVENLVRKAERAFDRVDVVINNATIAPLGPVKEVPIRNWDDSYRVNLRGPVLLARAFLPGMLARGYGVFVCVSSTGTGYMGAYETFKAAQVHLATTLEAELEGTGVVAFTIGPGFAPTQTAAGAIPRLAALMGESTEALTALLADHTIPVEAAGAGFAAAVALAERYRGQEIASIAALIDAGIEVPEAGQNEGGPKLDAQTLAQIAALAGEARATLAEQSAGWAERSLFERQWLIRTFRQKAGKPVEAWLETLEQLEARAAAGDAAGVAALHPPLEGLAVYYRHLGEAAKGYVKDPTQREEQLRIVCGWQEAVERLAALLETGSPVETRGRLGGAGWQG